MGNCILRRADFARLVADAMHFFDSTSFPPEEKSVRKSPEPSRYELDAYVVMPNHVHAILRPLQPQRYSLEDILGSWKQHTARLINSALHTSGEVWQDESFDRIIRDEEHLWRTIQYIGRNPMMAGLASEVPLWIRPEWEKLRWRFASEA